MFDLDINESKKPDLKIDKFIKSDAKKFIEKLSKKLDKHDLFKKNYEWYNFVKILKSLPYRT